MSLGFSVGDFVAVSQLTNAIRRQLVDAPDPFRGLSQQIKVLSNVLRDTEDVTSEQALTRSQKEILHQVTKRCREVLLRLSKELEQFREPASGFRIASNSRRKLRWIGTGIDRKRWDELTSELAADCQTLTLLNDSLLRAFTLQAGDITIDTTLPQRLLLTQQDQQEHDSISDWLAPIDYSIQQSDLTSSRQEGTGKWLLDSAKFHSWLVGDAPTLFCPGKAGVGKTIFTSIVVDHLRQRYERDPDVGIAYVYCNFQRQHEQRPIDLLASVLRQLAQTRLVMPEEVRQLYNLHRQGATYPSLDEIVRSLRSLVSSFRRIFILVDALDELWDSSGRRGTFLSEVFCLRDVTMTSLFVTSRFDRETLELFHDSLSLEIRASQDDLQAYLSQQIAQLPVFVLKSPELQREIRERITATADSMFLLAKLHMDSLAAMPTAAAIRRALTRLSSGLDHAYQSAMERIQGQGDGRRELAKQVLSWVTFAMRPLTASELQHAIAVEFGKPSFDSGNIPDHDVMVSTCAGLVVLEQGSNTIHLLHFSTLEYFLRTQQAWFPERQFAQICLTYLSLDPFKVGFSPSDKELQDRLDKYPFLDYAARYWGEHARERQSPEVQKLAESLLTSRELLSSTIQAMHSPSFRFGGYSQTFPRDVSGLHIAALFGLHDLTSLMTRRANINESSDYYGTPLQAAAMRGHLDVVKLLLDEGARISDQGGKYDFATQAAAYGGNVQVVETLLKYGADPDAMLNGRFNALHVAASNGHTAVAKTLLAAGAKINAKDGEFGRTALARATWNGHKPVIQHLLESEADINALDQQGSTALHLALEKHHESIINLLIDNGARLDVTNEQEKTPAQMAFQDIRRIDPSNFEIDPQLSRDLEPRTGTQAKIKVLRLKGDRNMSPEKYSVVFRKTFYDAEFKNDMDAGIQYLTCLTREREALRDLNHPNIVKFLAYDEEWGSDSGNRRYRQRHIFMEYCKDGDLKRYVRSNKEKQQIDKSLPYLTAYEAWSIVADLASALAYCHHGLFKDDEGNYSLKEDWEPRLHRDIKPGNVVMSTSEQSLPVAKLCDLGLAKVWDGCADSQTRKIGTMDYLPPEVKRGDPWIMKGDIYALGATIQDLRMGFKDNMLEDCLNRCKLSRASEILKRPSSIRILQTARKRLGELTSTPDIPPFLPDAPGDMDYMAQVVLETLKRLFQSYSIYFTKRTNSTASRIKHLIRDGSPGLRDGSAELLHKLGLQDSVDLAIILQEEEKAVDLISSGRTNKTCHWDSYGITSLHLACLEGLELAVRALVRADSALLGQPTKDNSTPLHWAVENGQWKTCILLLELQFEREVESESDAEARDDRGWTQLHHAAFDGQVLEIESLLYKSEAFVDTEDECGRSPLMLAANRGQKEVVERLLAHGANVNLSSWKAMCPLNQALLRGHLDTARVLLEAGASRTGRDRFGHAPLFIACARTTELVDVLIGPMANVAEDLVGGITALHLAAHAGNIALLDRLFALHLDVDLPEGARVKGDTPLVRAIEAQQEDAVALLLARGADPNYETETTWTCVLKAAEIGNCNIMEMLVRPGSGKVDTNAVCKPGNRTALHIACQNGHQGAVELLLKRGWDVNAKDVHGATPLHLAVKIRHADIVQMLIQRPLVDLNAERKPEEWTPLHIACNKGSLIITKLLYEAGASPDVTDINGRAPLDLARADGEQEIVDFLAAKEDETHGTSSSDSGYLGSY